MIYGDIQLEATENECTVALLGLVSPGAATDGVTPIFYLRKTDDLFSYQFCT